MNSVVVLDIEATKGGGSYIHVFREAPSVEQVIEIFEFEMELDRAGGDLDSYLDRSKIVFLLKNKGLPDLGDKPSVDDPWAYETYGDSVISMSYLQVN